MWMNSTETEVEKRREQRRTVTRAPILLTRRYLGCAGWLPSLYCSVHTHDQCTLCATPLHQWASETNRQQKYFVLYSCFKFVLSFFGWLSVLLPDGYENSSPSSPTSGVFRRSMNEIFSRKLSKDLPTLNLTMEFCIDWFGDFLYFPNSYFPWSISSYGQVEWRDGNGETDERFEDR